MQNFDVYTQMLVLSMRGQITEVFSDSSSTNRGIIVQLKARVSLCRNLGIINFNDEKILTYFLRRM